MSSLNNFKFLWLIVIISYICLANARQIRYSRYNTEVLEGNANRTDNNQQNEPQTTVREIKMAPYPASGFRPSKAFPLPNESSTTTKVSANVPVTDEIPATTPDTLALPTSTMPATESDATATSASLAVEAENDSQDNYNANDSINVEAGEDVMTENELPKAPYPAAGFQPRIPFLLPTDNLEENSTELAITEIPEESSTDLPLDTETSTGFEIRIPVVAVGKNLLNKLFNDQQQPQVEEENVTELSITEVPEENTTDMPIDLAVEAPYPAAGYRPSQAFLLPTEQLTLEETEDEPQQASPPKEETEDEPQQASAPKEDNSKHPVCGSSTNPLAPKPIDGEKADPDSESIFLNGKIQRNQQIINVPVRYTAQPLQPLLITRPFVYTTYMQSW